MYVTLHVNSRKNNTFRRRPPYTTSLRFVSTTFSPNYSDRRLTRETSSHAPWVLRGINRQLRRVAHKYDALTIAKKGAIGKVLWHQHATQRKPRAGVAVICWALQSLKTGWFSVWLTEHLIFSCQQMWASLRVSVGVTILLIYCRCAPVV